MPCVLLTHPEVIIDPSVPIERWGLSGVGRARASRAAAVTPNARRIVSSTETKAWETATILAHGHGLPMSADGSLGEMDRSSTGFVPPERFDMVVDEFFRRPYESVEGWERAIDAQRRTVDAVRSHSMHPDGADTVFVTHGGVGALLLASLVGSPISRRLDQPGLGSFFVFDSRAWRLLAGWSRL